MDILTMLLRMFRQSIEATGAPPDALQELLFKAERHYGCKVFLITEQQLNESQSESESRARRGFGGAMHHISRVPHVPTKARVAQLSESGLAAPQISERLGISDRHVRRVLQSLRQADE